MKAKTTSADSEKFVSASNVETPKELEQLIERIADKCSSGILSKSETIVAIAEMSVHIYNKAKAEQKEKFKNIYTILKEIDFEKSCKDSSRTLACLFINIAYNESKDKWSKPDFLAKEINFLVTQQMFSDIQKFYDNVLNTHVEDLSVKADKEEKKVNSDSMDILKLLKDNGYENDAVYDLIQNHIQSIAK